MEKHSFVLAVRKAVGESQSQFADRLGVSLRSIKRYEVRETEPRSVAIQRALESLAKRHGVTREMVGRRKEQGAAQPQ